MLKLRRVNKMKNSEKKTKIEILDCTIRDGGYVNCWDFDFMLARETYRALSKSGVDYVELGYHGTEKYFDKNKYGAFRFCQTRLISDICSGINGARVALMVDHGKYELGDLFGYVGSPVKLIRSAFHKNNFKEALENLIKIKKMGFEVSANFMGFVSYSKKEIKELLSTLKDLPIDYAYVADTYGSMFPDQLAVIFEPLLEIKHVRWGFHPHNNLQMAFANSLAAIKAGAQIIDSSVFGMGRGAGNLPTEVMLAYLHRQQPDKYNVIPVLNLIDHYYNDLHKQCGWGYNLPYMLSGTYGCHPNYASNLVERKEYDIEDIWNIMEAITVQNPIGFKKELVDNVLRKGIFGKKVNAGANANSRLFNGDRPRVSYINRHKEKDFLILANGPTLKQFQSDIQAFIDKYKPVVMGGNYLGGMFMPDYHVFTNKRRFVDYVGSVAKKSKLMISQHLPKEMIADYVNRDYELIYYEDSMENAFAIQDGVISANCRTVAVLLAGVALVMGAKRIFIVGMDGYMATSPKGIYHFYNEKNEAEQIDDLKEKHNWNLNYLKQIDSYMVEQGGEGLHIITPTNYKEFYKGLKNYL
ncbi:hypothetical protein A2276_06005 [candidate division WOR-1 bacterium RIFOXYA12_FULL_43_27]|uniref:Pyruvate carboxyltransferase domain-containing protein n=1 Tax=candidate division WOR-1 bacterium RIFOXYC2_FULL_46_14 TaxID=1802587 RepID=A0A1F4U3G0_UNCSA|nr:MAG: hypothetical protein A2276_06005 [candidate division WOR-1 bacterium RIFOXYA12_FULL_43_27]OGC20212.1 MAG: hypothetical protein A2292_04005 [candidate division WOR-1 bacterium RIFOXYB2_FULL_46_45]OGC32050.1 MAG: hypothetical protein A2232_07440 [candidate division WOR-1 bacterium RIFOXYA2_FULL_46_56]OGC39452.1 MAG: hypothetical protein A2438_07805 [candidate division WOR-1 bacterium RIFOXYC2_FULL_46_14]